MPLNAAMDGNSVESSRNSAPVVLHNCLGHTLQPHDPRISRSGGVVIPGKLDVGRMDHSSMCNDLHLSDSRMEHKLPGFRSSTSEVMLSCHGTNATNWVQMNKNRRDYDYDVEKEGYLLSPFDSFEKESPRKRIFTLLDSYDMIPCTSTSTVGSLQEFPSLRSGEMDLNHGSSSAPSKIHHVYDGGEFQERTKNFCEASSSLPLSISEASSAVHGTKGYCVKSSSSSSASQNFISSVKLESMSVICTEDKNGMSKDGQRYEEHMEKQNPSFSRSVPFCFHGHSMLTVSGWRMHRNNTSKNKEFLQVKEDYWVGNFHLQAHSENRDVHKSLNLVFPKYNKSNLGKINGLSQKESEKTLYVRDESPKSMSLDNHDVQEVRSLVPSWMEKYSIARENAVDGVHNGRGQTAVSMESRMVGLIGNLDASNPCNSIPMDQAHLDFTNLQKKEPRTLDHGTLVSLHSSSSVRSGAMEVSYLQPDVSYKCITSSNGIKRAKMSTDEDNMAILSPTSSYNNECKQDSLNMNRDHSHYSNECTLPAKLVDMFSSRTVGSGEEDHISHAKMSDSSNLHVPLENVRDPSNRWVSRLKLHPTYSFALGIGSTQDDDSPINGGVDKLYTRVLNYSRSNSKFAMATSLEQCKTGSMSNPESSRVETLKKSQAWIRRWCCNNQNPGNSRMMQANNALCPKQCGQESTRVLPENLEGRRFPSIAAMALMGKAASSFRPSEFKRRGTSLIWNTEGF